MTKTVEQAIRTYRMLDHIEAHPDSHHQAWWVRRPGLSGLLDIWGYTAARVMNECGTTACAAGWTVLLAGGHIEDYQRVRMPDGRPYSIPDAAADLLGLDRDEREALFHRAQDLADVRKAVFEIFGPRPDAA